VTSVTQASVRAFFARARSPPLHNVQAMSGPAGRGHPLGFCTPSAGLWREGRCACSLTWIRRRLEIQTTVPRSSPFVAADQPAVPASVRVSGKNISVPLPGPARPAIRDGPWLHGVHSQGRVPLKRSTVQWLAWSSCGEPVSRGPMRSAKYTRFAFRAA